MKSPVKYFFIFILLIQFSCSPVNKKEENAVRLTSTERIQLNAAERPNVIIILVDDMGFSDIGAYGGEIKTPNIDLLAQGGVRFSQFYNASRCCPTRATLMTGLHPHLTGIGHMTNSPNSKKTR